MKLAPPLVVLLLTMVSWSSGQTTSGQWTYIVQNGGATITASTATGAVTIPSVLGGYAVKKVGASASPPVFRSGSGVTSVIIPDSVTIVGDNAFYGCTGLTSAIIGNGVTSIGVRAFESCIGLTSVTIPDSVTIVGDNAFYGCTGLTSAIIGNGVTSIGLRAFANCSGLTSVIIPDSVTSIGEYMFSDCIGLTSVTIPDRMTRIGTYAFSACHSLVSIFFNGNAPLLGTEALNTGSNTLVYYLAETIGWSSTFGGLTTVALGPPIISEQPFSVVANLGDAVEFSVLATSSVPLPLTYQWKKNGIAIEGATTAKLSVNSVQGSDAGIYSVVITNRYGSVRSSSAGLALSQGNLYTQAQVDAAYRSGFGLGLEVGGNNSAVLENPNQHGLYSLSQVQAINVGTPLLTRDLTTGKCKLTVGVQKSSDLVNFVPMVIPEGSAVINSQGEIEFEFNSADSAAFFRVQAK